MTNELIIDFGTHDDFYWELERIKWVGWIRENLNTYDFKLFSRSGMPATKAILWFADSKYCTMFRLAAPDRPPAVWWRSSDEKISITDNR